ncbi:MAG TPA: thioredoxin domain-containing protein [Candidatus Acidoferrales bacterium]|nr:thioredoxin domain-containing protein [Candidatus Acidoferrales bacterium]
MEARHTNRLAREKSPYLLQHAHNPVDWFAWGEEAFARARAGNQPIFLSIGYSTCHWCHVMERESFEDETVAAFLREHFVSIKVDREERPDVDKIYMTFVQATSGRGGWPLNVFLTPDLKPFFGGTYFPPDGRQGAASFREVLAQIAQLWRERRSEIDESAKELHARLKLFAARRRDEDPVLTPNVLRQALATFKDAYDPAQGGFGGAPKFPQPAVPAFVLRAAKRFGDSDAAGMVLHTCEAMAAGGIHDQLGGGFARYSVDAQWLVPHFEKMLYDNAQLAQLYLDAHLIAGDDRLGRRSPRVPQSESVFAATARDILDYVLRDMTHPDGGFYSAEDADSEGQEGKFYCWTQDELRKLLTAEEFAVAASYFGITREGNFVDHSHPRPLAGQNVLSIRGQGEPAKVLASAKAKMFAARAGRIRPHLDDKILASWNGLMLGAFARASVVLNETKYRAAAERNLAFLREKLWVAPDKMRRGGSRVGTLSHRWRDGERDQVQLLEGYAFLLDGVIQLYEASLEPAHVEFACELAEALVAKFYDEANGGFWQSPAGTSDLILHVKDDYDGAEPSGNSVATLALLKLAALTGRADFKPPAEATLRLSAARLQVQPAALAYLLQALDFWLEEPFRVVIAGDPKSPGFGELLQAAHAVYQPNKVVLGTTGAVEPFAKTLTAKNEATVYLCSGNACQPPTSDPAQVRKGLATCHSK